MFQIIVAELPGSQKICVWKGMVHGGLGHGGELTPWQFSMDHGYEIGYGYNTNMIHVWVLLGYVYIGILYIHSYFLARDM